MRASDLPSLRGFVTKALLLRQGVTDAINEVQVYGRAVAPGNVDHVRERIASVRDFFSAAIAQLDAIEAKLPVPEVPQEPAAPAKKPASKK